MEKMVNYRDILEFYKNKKVFVTGHTGFKGSWLCEILKMAGADVTGYSLEPNTNPALFNISNISEGISSIIGDICNYELLKKGMEKVQPEIVLHLAAQPIVKTGYREPRHTYEVNVMGTVNLLECCRNLKSVKSVLNVTTDKVYKNREWEWAYRENEQLDGFDPYSNSKSCSELVTHSFKNSFFSDSNVAVSTARAGNVIGGGDFAEARIIPDCVRAVMKNEIINVRNPYSTRPYQHVLEPLFAYLMIAKSQYEDIGVQGYYNVGPDECDCKTTGEVVELFCKHWGNDSKWENEAEQNAPHEASFLKLDCSKLKSTFGWEPRWNISKAIEKTCQWNKLWLENKNMSEVMRRQIDIYMGE